MICGAPSLGPRLSGTSQRARMFRLPDKYQRREGLNTRQLIRGQECGEQKAMHSEVMGCSQTALRLLIVDPTQGGPINKGMPHTTWNQSSPTRTLLRSQGKCPKSCSLSSSQDGPPSSGGPALRQLEVSKTLPVVDCILACGGPQKAETLVVFSDPGLVIGGSD